MTETTRPRQNRNGHLCPPWCETDHEEARGPAFAFHGGPVTRIEVDGRASLPDDIIVRAFHPGVPSYEPVVSVNLIRRGPGAVDPAIWLSPADAGQLAAILAAVDDWEQYRKLTAGLRRAAAQAAEENQ